MLLDFKVKNWQCFRDEIELSMRASKERRCSSSVTHLPKMYGTTKILPLAALYGANASGKTSLFEAISFLRNLVVWGTEIDESISLSPFALNADSPYQPTEFAIEFLIENRIYRYCVALNRSSVLAESLIKLRTKDEEILFSRTIGNPTKIGNAIENDNLSFIANNTRTNQLFLHNAVEQNSEEFKPFYDWFRYSLKTISIGGRYGNYPKMLVDDRFNDFASRYLSRYNTGACKLVSKKIEDEGLISKYEREVLKHFPKEMKDFTGGMQFLSMSPNGNRQILFIKFENGQFSSLEKLSLEHKGENDFTATFDLMEESTGTQRFVELLPAYFDLLEPPKSDDKSAVYIIDEIDRSAHSKLIIDLLSQYINNYMPGSGRQLIFTAHDTSLMDASFMRKDEVWLLSKKRESGSSTLSRIGCGDGSRSDNSLERLYRKGKYGGLPV